MSPVNERAYLSGLPLERWTVHDFRAARRWVRRVKRVLDPSPPRRPPYKANVHRYGG